MAEVHPLDKLLVELRDDQRRRWRAGDYKLVEDYLRKYPEILAHPEALLDFIYGEYCLREESGEAPQPEEYFERFPGFAARLRPLLELHQAMTPRAAAPSSLRSTTGCASRGGRTSRPRRRSSWRPIMRATWTR